MTKEELDGLISSEIRVATGRDSGQISEERRENMDFYLGEPFGNEIDGRSQVVSTDVQDVVESVMPELVETFLSGDSIVRFKGRNEKEKADAQIATDYIYHIINSDNDGFGVLHDAMKTSLIQKNGITKTWWDDTPIVTTETLSGINDLQLQELTQDPEIEIVEFEEEEPDDLGQSLYAAKIKRTDKSGKVAFEGLPPEQFLISRRATGLRREDQTPFCADVYRKTVSQLLEMGFDAKEVDRLPSDDTQDLNEEFQARFEDDEWPFTDQSLDPAMRQVWLYECYIYLDWDGDGIATLHQVYAAGSAFTVIKNPWNGDYAVEVDDHPYTSATPIRMPYKFFGRAVADLVKDIQLIKSTVQRQIMDNMYQINNARTEIAESHTTTATIDDWLNNRPGGVVRTKQPGGVIPIQTTPIIDTAFPLMEYWDGVKEERTGMARADPSNDARNALNQTYGGLQALMGAAQKRKLLIARVFAETFYKELYKKILRLVVNHQDRPRVIELRNKFVQIDPRSWNPNMEVEVNLGSIHGTKEQQVQSDMMLLQAQKAAVESGFPYIGPENIYNVFKRLAHNVGWKDADDVVTDPKSPEGQQMAQMAAQRQDPKMAEVQGKLQLEKMKTEAGIERDHMKAQSEVQKDHAQAAAEAQKDQAMAAAEAQKDMFQVETNREKMQAELEIARFKAETEMEIKRWEAEQRIEIERDKAQAAMAVASQKTEADIKNQAAKSNGKDKT